MLHGDPQPHLCWHNIAPRLTDRFTVILTDLRGRGESHKPQPLREAHDGC
ncbi:MAG: alpha/beta fold hydrolase [Rhizobiaceae bacterium]